MHLGSGLDRNLDLRHVSPCIDAGTNASAPSAISNDVAGRPRRASDVFTPESGIGAPDPCEGV